MTALKTLGFAKVIRKIQIQRFMSALQRVDHLRPVDTDAGRQDVAIGFLTCNRHLSLMMLAAKSFYHFSRIVCPLYVWDDGSLTSRDRIRLRRLFPTVRIFRRSELEMNKLAHHPLTLSFAQQRLRKYETYAPALKILGPLASPNVPERFILSDSDAFFFDWPRTIIQWLSESQPENWYIEPWSGHDNVPEEELYYLYSNLSIKACPRINSGLLLLHQSIFKLDVIEKILQWYQSRSYAWDIEQTIYRILMACSENAPFDRDDYVLCHRKYNAVCHHFFTSVILDESVVRERVVNLLHYIQDCEEREKPPIVVAQQQLQVPPYHNALADEGHSHTT